MKLTKQAYLTKRDYYEFVQLPQAYWTNNQGNLNPSSNFEQFDEVDYEEESWWETWLFNEDLWTDLELQPNINNHNTINQMVQVITNQVEDFAKNVFLFFHHYCSLIKQFIKQQFPSVFNQHFYDFSKEFDPVHNDQKVRQLINEQAHDWIIFRPKIIVQHFLVNPTFLIRWKNKLYLIEAKWSTNQKIEHVLTFIFYENVFKHDPSIHIDCYLTCLIQKIDDKQNHFILTAGLPLAKKVHIDQAVKKYYRHVIDFNQVTPPIINTQLKNFIHGDQAVFHQEQQQLSQIAAARPLTAELSSYVVEKQAISEKLVAPNVCNINSLFNKRLDLDDYPFVIGDNEMIEHYQTIYDQNNLYYCLNNNAHQAYAEVMNIGKITKGGTKIGFSANQLRWLHYLTNLFDRDLANKFFQKISDQLPEGCLSYDFSSLQWETFIDQKNQKLTINDRDYQNHSKWLLTANQSNLFTNWTRWRELLITIYPQFNFSGKLRISALLYQDAIAKWSPKFDQQQIWAEYFYDEETFQTLGVNEQFIVTQNGYQLWKQLSSAKTKTYYDFESYSTPISNIVGLAPYTQIVNQVSIINSDTNNKLSPATNLLFDPQKMSVAIYQQIIDAIYQPNGEHHIYIVFNQSFENSRLLEMAKVINQLSYYQKVDQIINQTFDLANFFQFTKADLKSKNAIITKQLQGFHSIKKVIALVPEALLKQAKAVDYSQLDTVQNGVICQALAINRAISTNITDKLEQEWLHNCELMKKYCENDVRSMIAVEYLVNQVVQQAVSEHKLVANGVIKTNH